MQVDVGGLVVKRLFFNACRPRSAVNSLDVEWPVSTAADKNFPAYYPSFKPERVEYFFLSPRHCTGCGILEPFQLKGQTGK